MTAIHFYEKTKPFYEFSNFYTNPKECIIIDDELWINTEQYFQANKFYIPDSPQHMEYYNVIKSTDSPMKAVCLGRQKLSGRFAGNWVVNRATDKRTLGEAIEQYKHLSIRPDWEQVKIRDMLHGLMCKFSQSESLGKLLLQTGDADIVEASPRDAFWGWGKDQQGENMLGKLLVDVRVKMST